MAGHRCNERTRAGTDRILELFSRFCPLFTTFHYLRNLFMFSKPDYIILIAAFVSFLFSISLWFGVFGADNKDAGIFVGLWVPSILGFGLFFKMSVKGRQI